MAAAGSVGAVAALTKSIGAVSDPIDLPIGLQLYTVAEDLKKDLDGTLHTIAEIGYREVETAGLPLGISAAKLRKALDSAGLKCKSAHFPLPNLLGDLSIPVSEAQQLGAEYLICPTPWVADSSRFKTTGPDIKKSFIALMDSFNAEDWKWNFEQFNTLGMKAKKYGLQFGYHNHGFEFRKLNGKIVFDELLKNTDPALVVMEMDCGWVANAGQDPVDYLERYPRRFHLLHVKDVKKGFKTNTGFETESAEVGEGVLDWRRIFEVAKRGGVRGYFVEQEPPYMRPPLEEIKISYDYLHQLKV